MAVAVASVFATASIQPHSQFPADPDGAQSLLHITPPRQNYAAQAGAVIVYALILGAALTLAFRPTQAPVEEEQAIELAPVPVDEALPPDAQPELEQPDVDDTPPPPAAIDPIAPIEEVKPVPKPTPKVEKKIEKPVERVQPRRDARPAPASRRPPCELPSRRRARRRPSSPITFMPVCSARQATPIPNHRRHARRISVTTHHSALPARSPPIRFRVRAMGRLTRLRSGWARDAAPFLRRARRCPSPAR